MGNYSLDTIAHAFGFDQPQKSGNFNCWGVVQHISEDWTYTVLLDGSDTPTTCALLCRAEEGDRVLVSVINGVPYITNVMGGCPYEIGDVYITFSDWINTVEDVKAKWPRTDWVKIQDYALVADGQYIGLMEETDATLATVSSTGANVPPFLGVHMFVRIA